MNEKSYTEGEKIVYEVNFKGCQNFVRGAPQPRFYTRDKFNTTGIECTHGLGADIRLRDETKAGEEKQDEMKDRRERERVYERKGSGRLKERERESKE